MNRVYSFPPLSDANARLLILGSMPGAASLRAAQYYAHPRNAFWAIIEALYGIDRRLEYAQRCRALLSHGVAVWDVLQACTRAGSLDSGIDVSSIAVNDFAGFLAAHRRIARICFNGAMAEQTFNRHVLPGLSEKTAAIPRIRLPSTSPANATFSFERKLAAWRVLQDAAAGKDA